MSNQPTSIEERLKAAADHLDGLVAKISPVQRDVRKVVKEFREFEANHVKKEDFDRLRSDYEKVVKDKQEQERQVVKKEDYERLRSDYKASEKDREKRAEEIRALKLEVERMTQARDKYRDQAKQHDQDREKQAKMKEQIDRIRSERNGAKDEVKRLRGDRVKLGHRFLNWALKNHTLSNPDTANLAIRAWLHDEGMLIDERSRESWGASNGFTISPGEPDEGAKPFDLPSASSPDNPGEGGSTPKRDESRQGRGTPSGERSAQPTAKGSAKNPPKSSDKAAGSGQEQRKQSDQGPPKSSQKAPGPVSLPGQKGRDNPPGPAKKQKTAGDDRGEKTRPAGEARIPDKGKKRAAPAAVVAAKRPCPSDPYSQETFPYGFDPVAHELFGDDDDDDDAEDASADAGATRDPAIENSAGKADPVKIGGTSGEKDTPKPVSGKTVSKHQALVELHRDICQSRPWRRYLYTAGHFLPDVGADPFKHPDHAIAVGHFRTETTRFWENCGEEVWKRMFQLTDKADNKAWERIVYQATHLVVELQILIDHSDFDDDLIRFLCFPHPAWPQLFHNPIALSDIAGLVSVEAATEYLSSEYSKYWPKVPNMRPDRKSRSWSYALGSTFAVVAKKKPGSSQAKALARRLFNVYDKTGKFKYDPVADLDRVCQILIRINKVAQDFVKDGAGFHPDRRFPLVTVRPKSDPDFPEQWFGGKEYPKTLYNWSGEADADFWINPPDASKLENPPDHEEDQEQSASHSETGSAYEEEGSKA